MKNSFFLFTILIIASCNSNKSEKNSIQKINPDDIRLSKIRHDTLSLDQISKIKIIQSTFEEVYPMSLDETITNFKRDLHPDSEIAIWLQMADAYKKYINSKHGKVDLQAKREAFGLILSRSMMSTNEALKNITLKALTEKDAKEVLSYYTAIPDPIDVVKKP